MLTPEEYRLILRTDLVSFIERAFYELNPQTKLLMADYIELLAAKLEECRAGKCRRLIVTIPPRYLKSHCVSIAFVAWVFGHQPAAQIICASYGQDLSDKLARDCRKIMQASWYEAIFKTRLMPDKKAVNDFMTADMGFRMSTSVGGTLTGRGADYIILDDPLKPEEALSESQRQRVNDWYESTLLSRLNDKNTGCIIIIMQRLHQDDLVGHVLAQEAWDVVNFPAIAEEDSSYSIDGVLGPKRYVRKAGTPLHPERESLAMLAEIRKRMGEYNFLSQYQQTPIPVGGAMVKTKWLVYCSPDEWPQKFNYVLQSWDTASKATELSDFSVCITMGVKGKMYYLLNVFRERLEYPELKRAALKQAQLYRPSVILIEDKSSGTSLLQDLKREGVTQVKPYNPLGNDKIMRLHAQTAVIEEGRLILPKHANWLADFVQELISFPGAKYDDQVDALAQALEWAQLKRPGAYLFDW